MSIKVQDATKEELIQYFFTSDAFGGGARIPAAIDSFLLIDRDDMVMAFFPCTRFEDQVLLSMRGDTYTGKGKVIDVWGIEKTLENFMRLNNERAHFGELITKLVLISMRGGGSW